MSDVVFLNKDSEYSKNRKKFSLLKVIFSPMFFIVIFCCIEVFLIVHFFDSFYESKFQILIDLISIAEMIYIVNSKKIKDSFKITWMIVFVIMPIFGVAMYFIFSFTNLFNTNRSKLKDMVLQSKKYYNFSYSNEIKNMIEKHTFKDAYKGEITSEGVVSESSFFYYFYNHAKIPAYNNSQLKYFDNGKSAFEDILFKMKNAKRFIFIEIFILSDGIVWQEMLKILKEKAAEGVEIKLLVDGLNSVSFFRRSYCKYLKTLNIDARIFKPVSPMLSNTY